ncbi:cyclic peptide export ABC transporter [Burkholderia sp. Ac-20379]|uniref:cyclic peptide export ABC transporter n=1 Tax=Burkholderia sp. Ac-20379 TaxID=2703900 RepID=UPI00197CD800|nr:cyclic peptide export ABC transporter [Burkholderia sp. Ac-20379]MBN3724547.1 cyclic peptide export ABC transporter [Burkholderia sp. Ac-20379]
MTRDTRDTTQANYGGTLKQLLKPFMPITIGATLLGVAGGLCTAWLLSVINASLHAPGGIGANTAFTFVALCVATLLCNAIAGIGNSVTGQRIIAALRKDISARIVCAPVAELERYKTHRLLSTLNSDVETVSAMTFSFPSIAVAAAVTVGCVAYMLVLSPVLFLIALCAIAIGGLINRYASGKWSHYYGGVRGAQDELQKQYRAITEGAKELRLNRNRRQRVFSERLAGAADDVAELKIKAMRMYYGANASVTTLFFVVIGLLLLLQQRLGVTPEVVSGFVIVLLYVRGPVDTLASSLPALSQARISFKRIAELSAQFATREARLLDGAAPAPVAELREIELRQASWAFPAVGDQAPFRLGPIDLKIERGDMLFVIGENGSGKTTLIKLLLGLYEAGQGQLLLNGEPVQADGMDAYRQLYSAVFADYHLFEDLVVHDAALLARAQAYLEQLEIAHKVKIEDGVFSTIDLSTGQRKRLALVHAMLEQRPVMMFDEWAADQDPTFRRVFYTVFLPELKRQGKTLIVVSHDDRYFHVADRVIRIERGQIIQSSKGSEFVYEDRGTAAERLEGIANGQANDPAHAHG